MGIGLSGRERSLSSSQAHLTMPTFKQQAEENSFNKLLISKIHEIVKQNPLSKTGVEKPKFSATSMHNMKSQISVNSPRNTNNDGISTGKA
jgi:hypothetical protein